MSTATRPQSVDELKARYQHLTQLLDRVNNEIDAVAAAIRMHGEWRGRPRVRAVMSTEEAKRAHSAWTGGLRTQWAVEGHRQYKREAQRRYRTAA